MFCEKAKFKAKVEVLVKVNVKESGQDHIEFYYAGLFSKQEC